MQAAYLRGPPTCAHVRVLISHSLTLLSLLPVAKAVPLECALTDSTHDSCPAAVQEHGQHGPQASQQQPEVLHRLRQRTGAIQGESGRTGDVAGTLHSSMRLRSEAPCSRAGRPGLHR